jgi:predicted transcriptional regulator
MKMKQIVKILNAEVISSNNKDIDLEMGCGADLMSDVLRYIKPGSILLTGLTNIQVIYTASTAGIKAICFVRGKKPQEETIELAKKKNIALLTTGLPMFESCGKLYSKGLIGCSEVSGVSER